MTLEELYIYKTATKGRQISMKHKGFFHHYCNKNHGSLIFSVEEYGFSSRLFRIIKKVNNFCEFLFTFFDQEATPKWVLTFKEDSKYFPLRVNHLSKSPDNASSPNCSA